MPNYRGGERAMSGYGAEAVKAIREGRTQSQQDRDLREKILMGSLQAGLMAGRGIAGAVDSKDTQAKQANHAWDVNNMNIQSREREAEAQSRAMSNGRALEAGKVPAWANQNQQVDAISGGGGAQPDMVSGADRAMANQKQNDAADAAPLGGYFTPDGSQAAQDQANALTNDMKTAEDGMRGGGMMGSRQRRGMY